MKSVTPSEPTLLYLMELRGKLIAEGVRLGASPVEMGKLLSECVKSVGDLGRWDEAIQKGEEAS